MAAASIKDRAGTAYHHQQGSHDKDLTEVARGTPMGELMRRYWHAVALSAEATDLPKQIRALGEDLILFRDKQRRPGLVHPRCVHRGSSLLYARIDDAGLRCCYHGWAFDVEGRCTDQPCEPQNGLHRDKVRQPWYPVEERYGLVWAYMGPADKKPLLPRYNVLENLAEDERLFADGGGIGSGASDDSPVPFNWLQHFENIHDPGHFLWLHYFHSGPQFGPRFGEFESLDFAPWKWLETQAFRATERGVTADRTQSLPDGSSLRTVVETVLPMVRVVPNPFGQPGPVDNLGFMLPVDDTHFKIFTVLRGRDDSYFKGYYLLRDERERQGAADPVFWQRFPSDWEAQGSQGPITLHGEEHLATSDKGIVMLRRLYRQQLAAVAAGKDPIGVIRDPDQIVVELEAGAFITPAAKPASPAATREAPARAPQRINGDATQQAAQASGLWNVVIRTPMGDDEVTFDLHVEGGQVNGVLKGSVETNAIVDGRAEGNTLSWHTKVSKPFPMELKFVARLDGAKISGDATSPFGAVPFTGERA